MSRDETDLIFIVIITVVEVIMTEPPLVLHVNMMVKLIRLGLLELHTRYTLAQVESNNLQLLRLL